MRTAANRSDARRSRRPPTAAMAAARGFAYSGVMALTLSEYHARSKHSLVSVRAGAHALDWDNQPLPFKVYPDLDGVPLPTDLPGSQRPALATLAPAAAPAQPVDTKMLAHFLYFSAGVLRTRKYAGGLVYYRAAACTGALYHVDVYVVAAALDG